MGGATRALLPHVKTSTGARTEYGVGAMNTVANERTR